LIRRYLVVPLVLAIVLISLSTLVAPPVFANPGFTVTSAIVVADVSPGQTLTHVMTLSIAATDPATDVQIQVMGVTQSSDGNLQPLDASQDTGNYSARSFVTVDKSTVHLEPGVPQDVTATIQVPQDVGDGGRYAIIHIATQPTGGGGVTFVTAVNVPIYLTISGSQILNTGKIIRVSAGEVTSGQPVDIFTYFQNTGNHHFKVEGQVSITNSQKQVVGTIAIPLTSASILPGMTRELVVSFAPNNELEVGTYTIDSKITLEDGTLLDEATGSFVVGPSVSPTLTQTAPPGYTLQTPDGRISIYFPPEIQIPANISLAYYPANQLPGLPSGFTSTDTCFKVSGLSGTLAAEATITVKFSPDDLGKAGGNAARFRLAFWDEGNSRWVILSTNLDATAMTLTATNNQVGPFALLVGAPAATAGEASWVLPVAIVAGVIIIALVVIILISLARQRPRAPEE